MRHTLEPDKVHYKWNRDLHPAIEVESGDVVRFETDEVSGGQIRPGTPASALAELNFDRIYPLAGPVLVKGAQPGDVLEVEIVNLRPKGWGWTGIIPNLGLLPEDFPEPYIKHWDLSNGRTAELRPGVVVPLEPFCGVMGVAPAEPGEIFVLPPGKFGGNMDIRHLTKGTTLFLPVQVEGALFSAGDCHAAQGDGEVCVTGIEAPMTFTLRFGIRKDLSIPEPQFITPGPLTQKHDRKGYYATAGIAPDLMEATKKAIRAMITHLQETHGLTREEAYVLCSVAVDLKISEVVDAPNWIVSAYLPTAVFRRPRARRRLATRGRSRR